MIRISLLLSLLSVLCACQPAKDEVSAQKASPPASPDAPQEHLVFVDRASELDIDFRHDPAFSGRLFMPEILGAGAAVFDGDGDGDLEVLLVQSRGADASTSATGGSRLYRNLLLESGQLHFEDVTTQSGLRTRCYGTGVTAGDFDNDGSVDLYVTNFGANRLYRTTGRRFDDVATTAGVAVEGCHKRGALSGQLQHQLWRACVRDGARGQPGS